MLLKDKVALITGAGSGFGKATSLLFAEQGAKVVVVDFNAVSAEETVNEIKANGGEAVAVTADISKEELIKEALELTVKEYGRLDILFNNAGIYVPGNVEETDYQSWQKSFSVNVDGIFYAMKHALPLLRESKGNIINTASAAALIGFGGAVSYAATKGAVLSLTRAAAVDYAEEGIRVNAICPGTGVTGMTESLLEDENIYNAFVSPIPMKKLGQPEDVAHAALYLASDLASYVTGHALPVDGGWTMS